MHRRPRSVRHDVWLQSGSLDSLCAPQAAGHWSASRDTFWEQAEGLVSLRFTPTDDSEAGTELLKCLCCPRSAPPDVRQNNNNNKNCPVPNVTPILPGSSPWHSPLLLAISLLSSHLPPSPNSRHRARHKPSNLLPVTTRRGPPGEVCLWSFSPLCRRDSRDPEQGVIFLSFSVGKRSSLEVPSGATLGLPELLFLLPALPALKGDL